MEGIRKTIYFNPESESHLIEEIKRHDKKKFSEYIKGLIQKEIDQRYHDDQKRILTSEIMDLVESRIKQWITVKEDVDSQEVDIADNDFF